MQDIANDMVPTEEKRTKPVPRLPTDDFHETEIKTSRNNHTSSFMHSVEVSHPQKEHIYGTVYHAGHEMNGGRTDPDIAMTASWWLPSCLSAFLSISFLF